MPWPLSSSSISRYVLNREDWNYFQPSKMKEHEVDFEGKWDAVAKRRMQ